ncbi:MAG: glycosyltransferase family 1 protein [Candidatus Nitrosopelagicus sp.]|nr:glycosyltransferase family 1 protein [Candidatus Nitrosopelagicus sp.]
MQDKKIKVAFIYRKCYNFFQPDHFDRTSYDFFFKALKRNEQLEISYYPCEKKFDVANIKGKCDVILLANNRAVDYDDGSSDGAPDELIGIKKLDVPVVSRTGDPHDAKKFNQIEFCEKNKIDYLFSSHPDSLIYKYYPKKIKQRIIIYGLESQSYQTVPSFKTRIKDRILITGKMGRTDLRNRIANYIINPRRSSWYLYKLRTLCSKLNYVEYNGMKGKQYVNEDYPTYTSKYRAIISATTFYPTLKYWENAAAGCLTFMEITKKNDGYFLGYKNNETAIFIDEKNYKDKFEQYISDPNNPKWEEIANAGREYTMKYLTNDTATDELAKLMHELIK